MSEDRNNVVAIHGAELPSDQVLRLWAEQDLQGVVVCGWRRKPDANGKMFFVASSYGDAAEKIIYTLEHAKLRTLEQSR